MESFVKSALSGLPGYLIVCLYTLQALGFPLVPSQAEATVSQPTLAAMDFHEVDVPIFVRFISELTGKNFVLDEQVKKAGGKVTVFSPTRVSIDHAYRMFLATLEVARLALILKGSVYQIVPAGDLPPERGVFVYKLKHANAIDLTVVLTNLVARSQTVAQATPGSRPPIRPLTEFEAPVHVFADKATNSVIISASKYAHTQLKTVIATLDTPRQQVFVEAVILEVQVDRLRQLGSDPPQVIGSGKSGFLQGMAGFNRVPEDLSSIAQTLSGTSTGESTVSVLNTINVRLFMQFLMSSTDANILSTPQVLAADNQKAKIVVGENRPFPTGQSQGITGGTLVTIERKDVGVTLELTPQVLEDDMVRLEIKQEISAIAENVAQTIGSGNSSIAVGPTTTKRAMETTTVAHNEQTLVIGGLIRDNLIVNERKIPLLGDMPWIGWLFKSESRQVEKLNLLVFLTPHIISGNTDVVNLNERKAHDLTSIQRENRVEEPTRLKQEMLERLQQNDQTLTPSSSHTR